MTLNGAKKWMAEFFFHPKLFPAAITFSYTKTSKDFTEGHGIGKLMEIRAKIVQRTAVADLRLVRGHRAERELKEVRGLGIT